MRTPAAPQAGNVVVVVVDDVAVVVVDVPSGQTTKQFSAPTALHAPPTPMLTHACPVGHSSSEPHWDDPVALPTIHTGPASQCVISQPLPAVAHVPPHSPPQADPHAIPPLAQVGAVVVVVDDVAVVVVVVGQAPQSSVPPQPSESMPQSCGPQVAGVQQALWEQTCPLVQAETQVWLAPQVRQALESQVPQVSMSPQSPSAIIPHFPTHELGVQQVPKSGFAFPGGEAGFMQSRLQQLMFV